jgi:hypothetical protein
MPFLLNLDTLEFFDEGLVFELFLLVGRVVLLGHGDSPGSVDLDMGGSGESGEEREDGVLRGCVERAKEDVALINWILTCHKSPTTGSPHIKRLALLANS